MKKAKSRLKITKSDQSPDKKSLPKLEKKSKRKNPKSRFFLTLSHRYWRYLPILLLSLPFYLGTYYIFSQVHPATIEHILIPNSYLLLQLSLFLGNFFFLSFLLLSTRRGFELTLVLNFALFLKLQQVTNYLPITGVLVAVFLVTEFLISLFKKK
jgi:hypothetical protein